MVSGCDISDEDFSIDEVFNRITGTIGNTTFTGNWTGVYTEEDIEKEKKRGGKLKFKIGDIIKTTDSGFANYAIESDRLMKVINIDTTVTDDIYIQFLKADGTVDSTYRKGYWVCSKHFKLNKEVAKKKLIQYKPGMNITEYIKKLITKETDKERLKWLRTFDNCVLPDKVKEMVHDALSIVLRSDMFDKWGITEHFEKGLTNSILIYGPPGTGKTMISESIASVLGKNLMRVNNEQIQSNIPGQTEKNISKSFKKARKEDCVILLDECDSLLYNRDAVGAILAAEINHLLTEIERFDGICILTTNRLHKLDVALQRRIIAKIELPMPNFKARVMIYKKLIPPKMPVVGLDYAKLASPEDISGGDIKNVILLAARRAIARNDDTIGMVHFNIALENVVEAKKQFMAVQPKKFEDVIQDVGIGVSKTRDKVRHTQRGMDSFFQ